jgi:hypothetical protein
LELRCGDPQSDISLGTVRKRERERGRGRGRRGRKMK